MGSWLLVAVMMMKDDYIAVALPVAAAAFTVTQKPPHFLFAQPVNNLLTDSSSTASCFTSSSPAIDEGLRLCPFIDGNMSVE